jgi:hypothetical protein
MASEPPAAPPDARDERASIEARLMIERAEHAWRRQVEDEEGGAVGRTRGGAPFRWLLLALAGAAIVLLLFDRLTQLG